MSLGLLVAVALGQDWTCAECEEGGAAVGALASSEEAINGQAGLLVAGVCPQAPDPAYCAASLPGFWASLGPIIMVEHFKHICDDMEQCKPPPPPLGPRVGVPNCQACIGRVNGATDALAWEETITAWVGGLTMEGGYCDAAAQPDQCKDAVQFLIPLALPLLASQPRDWVDQFCFEWGACKGADWTCDECEEGAAALGQFTTTPEATQAQTEVLLAEVCPGSDDPDACVTKLPAFWAELAVIILPQHFTYICDDLQCAARTAVPSCDTCVVRINGVTDALGWEETVTGWVDALTMTGGFCDLAHPTEVEQCKEGVNWLLPLALPALVAYPDRGWVQNFCADWGCQ